MEWVLILPITVFVDSSIDTYVSKYRMQEYNLYYCVFTNRTLYALLLRAPASPAGHVSLTTDLPTLWTQVALPVLGVAFDAIV